MAKARKGNWRMNDKAFQDKVKENFNSVMEEGASSLKKLDQSTGKLKEQITTWSEDGSAQFGRKFKALKGATLDKVAVTAKSLEQDLDRGLNQYNVKVQDLANQVPGNFSEKAARYPWVTISISLAVGLLLGMLLKPVRRPMESR